MPTGMDRLSPFLNYVINEANNKRGKVEEDIEKYKIEALNKAEIDILNRSYKYIQDGIAKANREKAMSVSNHSTMLKKKLLNRREDLFNELFDTVQERIKEFTHTSEYGEYMRRSISEAVTNLQEYGLAGAQCLCMEKDIPLFEPLTVQGANVISTDADIIGGFILRDTEKGYSLDCSLKRRIENEKRNFLGNSELVIL